MTPANAAEVETIRRAVDGFIRPAYADFAAKTEAEKETVSALCAAPSKTALDAARTGFVDMVRAWSMVETIRIGPVTEKNRHDRILYWPDRKGIGLKQVQSVLAEEDPSATDPVSLAGKSIAMQGLGALEFVLFGAGSDDLVETAKPYRCRFGAAIAQNLASIASDISVEWQADDGFANQWMNPGPNNALYRNELESANDFIAIFVQGLEMTRDVRLNGFLGADASGDKPKQAIYWRSNATVPSLAANLDGLKRAFAASRLAARLTSEETVYIGSSIDFEFANAQRALAGLDQPVADLLKDEQGRQKLTYFRLVTSSLTDLFGSKLSGALGLSAGFSSLDGD
ncbi:peptidase M75, Imelysin [Salmonella enterica subsp. enterica]|nr:peptidase M75, Imelysin [Salmonella enterica subsp. enterica]